MAYTRKCLKCGHRQGATDPAKYTLIPDYWRKATCNACDSPTLDFGTNDYIRKSGKWFNTKEEEQ